VRVRSLCLLSDEDWRRQLNLIGADACTWDRLSQKSSVLVLAVDPIPAPAATILKQCMLSGGADAIVSRDTITCSIAETPVLIAGTPKQLVRAVESLRGQPFGLGELALLILSAVNSPPSAPQTIQAGDRLLDFADAPLIMGILNLTPDSFSDGGVHNDITSAVARALEMTENGAQIIDIGAESTRPGSDPVPPDVQIDRLMPVLRRLADEKMNSVISIDTSSAEVGRAVLEAGAGMINDVTALSDPGLAEAAAAARIPVVLMHMAGVPRSMQHSPVYTDVLEEVYSFLESRIEKAVASGISRERIIVDPGIGFGKRLEDNISLIRRLSEFKWLGCRILLGHSRKSFLGALSGEQDPVLRDCLSHLVSGIVCGSTDILRVHDVKGTVQTLKVARELRSC